jgi:hypothetical protein
MDSSYKNYYSSFKINKMLFNKLVLKLLGFGSFWIRRPMSESGFTGLKNLQDLCIFLSETFRGAFVGIPANKD